MDNTGCLKCSAFCIAAILFGYVSLSCYLTVK